ncbi:MAG: hypothetical protein WCW84_00140 [Sulfurimonas sp.]
MNVKVSLTLNTRRYDIDVEEDFSRFLNAKIEEDFEVSGNNDLKLLLEAYVRTNFSIYTQEQQIKKLIETLQK